MHTQLNYTTAGNRLHSEKFSLLAEAAVSAPEVS